MTTYTIEDIFQYDISQLDNFLNSIPDNLNYPTIGKKRFMTIQYLVKHNYFKLDDEITSDMLEGDLNLFKLRQIYNKYYNKIVKLPKHTLKYYHQKNIINPNSIFEQLMTNNNIAIEAHSDEEADILNIILHIIIDGQIEVEQPTPMYSEIKLIRTRNKSKLNINGRSLTISDFTLFDRDLILEIIHPDNSIFDKTNPYFYEKIKSLLLK